MLHLHQIYLLRRKVAIISKFTFGFDIDGVLTNDDDGNCSIWLKEASEYFGIPVPQKRSYYIEDAFGKSREEVEEFFQARVKPIIRSVPMREHARKTLQLLHENKHTIYLITARDEHLRKDTVDWLARHEIPYNELYMSPPNQSYSKGSLCQKLDVGFFVDDKLENALDTASHGIYTLLFHASHNLGIETSLPLVKNWLEVQRHIDSFLAGA